MPSVYRNDYGRLNKHYRSEIFAEAIDAVKIRNMTIHRASKQYRVPYTTLYKILDQPERKKYGGQTVLSEAEEARLLQIIFHTFSYLH